MSALSSWGDSYAGEEEEMRKRPDKHRQARDRRDEVVTAATKAGEAAYAPYSGFQVGAAVLTATGRIFTGCNVENVSYGLTVCAERVAVWNAVAAGEREVVAVAVVTDGPLVFPCGACLQVIQEFAGTEPPVIIAANLEGAAEVRSLAECLPCAFTSFKPDNPEAGE